MRTYVHFRVGTLDGKPGSPDRRSRPGPWTELTLETEHRPISEPSPVVRRRPVWSFLVDVICLGDGSRVTVGVGPFEVTLVSILSVPGSYTIPGTKVCGRQVEGKKSTSLTPSLSRVLTILQCVCLDLVDLGDRRLVSSHRRNSGWDGPGPRS